MSSTTEYPTIQIRMDKLAKEDFFELAKLKGTTPSAILKAFIQEQNTQLPRLKRQRAGVIKQPDDFLN